MRRQVAARQLLFIRPLPDADASVLAAESSQFAVGAKGKAPHRTLVPAPGASRILFARGQVVALEVIDAVAVVPDQGFLAVRGGAQHGHLVRWPRLVAL